MDKYWRRLSQITLPFYFGFSLGHHYLPPEQIREVRIALDGGENEKLINRYEMSFARLVGPGMGVSFAAGRMAFYALLKTLGIGPGDEVILPGFTCAVMANAVFRSGAAVVYADIDADTFGSSHKSIMEKATPRTKLVVAQHSFGIPCDIEPIIDYCKSAGIFVLEDCAITLDSAVDGVSVGNFGDAALFSTDSTKPVNTLIGGLLYTREKALGRKLKKFSRACSSLSSPHQKRLFNLLLFIRKNYIPKRYGKASLFYSLILRARKYIGGNNYPVTLDLDFMKESAAVGRGAYPYPAQIPPFLAQLGLFELERWQEEKKRRKRLLAGYIQVVQDAGLSRFLPNGYLDRSLQITPLRFVFQHAGILKLLSRKMRNVDINARWFKEPIIGCPSGPENLDYVSGSCPVGETMGKKIINLPCVVPEEWHSIIIDQFREAISEA